jgi:hypothetical protein
MDPFDVLVAELMFDASELSTFEVLEKLNALAASWTAYCVVHRGMTPRQALEAYQDAAQVAGREAGEEVEILKRMLISKN